MFEEAHKIKYKFQNIQGTAMFLRSNTGAAAELCILYNNILYILIDILYILLY